MIPAPSRPSRVLRNVERRHGGSVIRPVLGDVLGDVPGDVLGEETGSILPLALFYAVLCLVVVLLVSAVTSLYLERERLYALADGAALAGAEAYDLDTVLVADGHPRPVLGTDEVRASVRDFLDSTRDSGFDGLRTEQAGSGDGRSATVRLSAVWHPPVVSLLVPDGIRIDAVSTARSVFR